MGLFSGKKYIILVCGDHFLIHDAGTGETREASFPVEPLPHTPFYHYLFQEGSQAGALLAKQFKFFRSAAYLLIPDDCLDVDKRILTDFCFRLRCRSVLYCRQGQLLGAVGTRYIALSRTSRAVAVSYVKDGEIKASRFLDAADFDPERVPGEIRPLHPDCEYERLPVLVNGMDGFRYEGGETVQPQTLIEHFLNIPGWERWCR